MNNIDILMATYNGAKFIASQIRSLLIGNYLSMMMVLQMAQ